MSLTKTEMDYIKTVVNQGQSQCMKLNRIDLAAQLSSKKNKVFVAIKDNRMIGLINRIYELEEIYNKVRKF